jgi:hypothetical protein
VRNFGVRKALIGAATISLAFCCFLAAAPRLALGADEGSAPLPFACEVRYHFREQVRNAKPGEKRVSAPSNEREALPVSRATTSDGSAVRLVEGRVAHLPFRFSIKIGRSGGSQVETLEVNVLDSAGKSLPGFPQTMPNPLLKTGEASRKEFEIPVDAILKKKIEKTLLAEDQFLTRVDLIVGMDDDFLSGKFPK